MAEFSDADKQAIGDKLDTVRTAMVDALRETVTAFEVFQYTREKLGIPVIDGTTFTQGDYDRLANLQDMIHLASGAIDDALNGVRKIGVDPQLGILAIERLPTDANVLAIVNGQVEMVPASQAETGLGIWPLLAIAAIATIGYIVLKYEEAQLLLQEAQNERAKIESKTQTDMQQNCTQAVANGTMTADQCKSLVHEIEQGQASIKTAEAKKEEAGGVVKPVTDLLTTGLYVIGALAVVGIGLAVYREFRPARAG